MCIYIDNKGIGLHVEKILTNFLKTMSEMWLPEVEDREK